MIYPRLTPSEDTCEFFEEQETCNFKRPHYDSVCAVRQLQCNP